MFWIEESRISLQILEFNTIDIWKLFHYSSWVFKFFKGFFKIADSKNTYKNLAFREICNAFSSTFWTTFICLSIDPFIKHSPTRQNSIQHVWHSFYDSNFRIEISNATIKAVIRFENNENLIAIKIKTRQTLPVNSINPSASFVRNWTNVYHRFERTFTNHALILTIFTCQ